MTTLAREAVQQLINALSVFDFRPLTQGELNSEEQMGASKIGVGTDFYRFRAFRDADDPKWIDLNTFARTRKLWTKECVQSVTSKITFAIDGSRSMGVNDGVKWRLAAKALLTLKALAHRAGCETEILVFSENIIQEIPNMSGPDADEVALAWFLEFSCTGRSGLRHVNPGQLDRSTTLFIFSDFMWTQVLEELDTLLWHGLGELALFCFHQPSDLKVPSGGFIDPETGQVGSLNERDRSKAQINLDSFHRSRVEWCEQSDVSYCNVDSGSAEVPLRRWLIERENRWQWARR